MYLGVHALENERKLIEIYLRCRKRFKEGYNNRQIKFKILSLYIYIVYIPFSRELQKQFQPFNSFCNSQTRSLTIAIAITITMTRSPKNKNKNERSGVKEKRLFCLQNYANYIFRFLV